MADLKIKNFLTLATLCFLPFCLAAQEQPPIEEGEEPPIENTIDAKSEVIIYFRLDNRDLPELDITGINFKVRTDDGISKIFIRFNRFSSSFSVPATKRIDFYSPDANFSDPDAVPRPVASAQVDPESPKQLLVMQFEREFGSRIISKAIDLGRMQREAEDSLILFNLSRAPIAVRLDEKQVMLDGLSHDSIRLSELGGGSSKPVQVAVNAVEGWEKAYSSKKMFPPTGQYLYMFFADARRENRYQLKILEL